MKKHAVIGKKTNKSNYSGIKISAYKGYQAFLAGELSFRRRTVTYVEQRTLTKKNINKSEYTALNQKM